MLDRGDETKTAFGEGLDISRSLGGIAERLAKFIDGGSEGVVEVDHSVRSPNSLA